MTSLAELGTLRDSLDSKADKQKFLHANHSLFMLPKQFEFKSDIFFAKTFILSKDKVYTFLNIFSTFDEIYFLEVKHISKFYNFLKNADIIWIDVFFKSKCTLKFSDPISATRYPKSLLRRLWPVI